MTTTSRRPASRLAAIALAALSLASTASAKDYAAGSLQIQRPRSRPTPPGAPTGAGYMVVVNTGKADDRLVSASSPAAATVELHEMSMTGGVMRMRPVPAGFVVPAGGRLELAPGGFHLMLIGLKAPLVAGAGTPVTLRFEKAGAVTVTLSVEAAK